MFFQGRTLKACIKKIGPNLKAEIDPFHSYTNTLSCQAKNFDAYYKNFLVWE